MVPRASVSEKLPRRAREGAGKPNAGRVERSYQNCSMTILAAVAYARRMIRFRRLLIVLVGVMGCGVAAEALGKDAAPPAEAPAAEKDAGPIAVGPALTAEEVAGATRLDVFSIPTPGELMASIDKLGKPDWASAIRPPLNVTSFSARPQMALNLGTLIADGFIAVEAEDAQQVKNIGKDITQLAGALSFAQEILNRGKSLTNFAETGQWSALREELEATQNEVKAAMVQNKDSSLITLVTLGGWIRGMEAMSDYVSKHYTVEGAKLLRQPAVARYLVEQLKQLPEKVRDEASVRRAKAGLLTIEAAVTFPADAAPNKEAVAALAATTSELVKDIAAKDPKK